MNVISLQTGIILLAVMSDASTETHPQRPLSLLKPRRSRKRENHRILQCHNVCFTGENHRDPISKPLAGLPAGRFPCHCAGWEAEPEADGVGGEVW